MFLNRLIVSRERERGRRDIVKKWFNYWVVKVFNAVKILFSEMKGIMCKYSEDEKEAFDKEIMDDFLVTIKNAIVMALKSTYGKKTFTDSDCHYLQEKIGAGANPYTTDLSNLKLYWTSEGYEKEIQISKISRLQLKEIPKDGREVKNILLVRVIDLPCCNIFRPEALFVKYLYRDKLLRGGVHISLNHAHCVADDGNFPIVSLDDKHVKFFSLKFICKKIEIVE